MPVRLLLPLCYAMLHVVSSSSVRHRSLRRRPYLRRRQDHHTVPIVAGSSVSQPSHGLPSRRNMLTGVNTARSTKTGSPRVLPLIMVAQRISLLRCLKLPLILVSTVGLPIEKPTFA